MEKEFIPYELALRMKQLGFNERCFKYEDAKKICENNACLRGCQLPNVHCGYPNCTIDRSVEPLAIPIWQQAFRWLYQKLDIEKGVMPLDTESQQLLLKELIDKVSSKHSLV